MTDVDVLKHLELPGIEIYLTQITPELARSFLEHNASGQRNLNPDVMARYCEDMEGHDWVFSGTPILFSDKGELIDGQHRLTAIARSGQSQLTLVVTGLTPDALHAIDQGRKRTYGALVGMKLERPSHNTQASLIRAYWYWSIGNYGDRGVPRIPVPSEYASATPSISQMEKVRKETEARLGVTFTAAVRVAQACYTQMPQITMTVWGLAWILLTEYSADAREAFFHELLGNPLSPAADYPINALKNRLGRLRTRGDLSRTVQLHYVLRTFEFWRTGRLMTTLTVPSVIAWNTLQQLSAPVKEVN